MKREKTPENGKRKPPGTREGRAKGSRESRLRKAERAKLAREARQLVDVELMRALSHDLRVVCLAHLSEGAASPKTIAGEIGEGLSDVSYHVKVLRELGLIELDRTKPRRGAVEHFYKPVYPALLPDGALAKLPGNVKQRLSVGILGDLFGDAAAASDARAFDGREGSHVSLMRLALDDQALKRLSALVDKIEAELDALQEEARKRLEKQGEDGVSITVGLASFESTRPPAKGRKVQVRKRC